MNNLTQEQLAIIANEISFYSANLQNEYSGEGEFTTDNGLISFEYAVRAGHIETLWVSVIGVDSLDNDYESELDVPAEEVESIIRSKK